MLSEIKYNYYQKNVDIKEDYFSYTNQNVDEIADLYTGWSFVCLDETISYYADNLINKS
uniref:Uncharacterized protein n=1 Tax=Polysiphonia sertularioides TaxID=945028 RepID=A0A1Z1MGH5_9FLOR|nr:hypothetical protein [Polysiphonia sertularioides]